MNTPPCSPDPAVAPPGLDRRQWLGWAAGLPMLPLALGACTLPQADAQPAASGRKTHGWTGRRPGLAPVTVRFLGMPAPTLANPAQMAEVHVASALQLRRADGATQTWQLAHQAFFTTGDLLPDGRGGQVLGGGLYDARLRPILDDSVSPPRPMFSDCPDGSSLLALPRGAAQPAGVQGNAVFAVVQYEYVSRNFAGKPWGWGKVFPSPMAVLTLDQDPATGRLKLLKYQNVDTSDAQGLWITCGASRSPWGSHLSSEEYEPDATRADNPALKAFGQAFFGDPARARAYDYGHLPEVFVNPDGSGRCVKHYCLGRISHELVQVMPDERTVLMGDDWSNGGLFLFIADRPRDLSAGTLYAAQWRALSADGRGDQATLHWIRLGHARSEDIRRRVAEGIQPGDFMAWRSTDPGEGAGFRRIPYAGKPQWVKFTPGMETWGAFLETHRYAAWAGASMGFTKMEGTTVNVRDKVAYSALSRIEEPMRDGSGGVRSRGPFSGGIYQLPLSGGQQDHTGQAMDSEWVPVRMAAIPALQAEDFGGGAYQAQDDLGNFAHPDKISQPDNLKFSEAMRVLFIGEDSSTHVNNFLWAWHVDTGELARIASMPVGAESTGLHAVEDVNGWSYILSHFQHPGDWEKRLHDKVRPTLEPLIQARWKGGHGSAVGYLTAAPAAHATAVGWPPSPGA